MDRGQKFDDAVRSVIIVSELLGESFPILRCINPYSITKALFTSHRSPVMNPSCVAEQAEYSPLQFGVQPLYVPQLLHGDLLWIGNVSLWKQENINRKAQLSPIEHAERQFTSNVRW